MHTHNNAHSSVTWNRRLFFDWNTFQELISQSTLFVENNLSSITETKVRMNNGNSGQPQYPGYAQGDTTQYPPQYPQQNYPPQPYPPAQGGAPQYPQAAYHPQGPQQQQQQSTNVVMVGAGSPIQPTYQTQPYISFTGAILLSCFTVWRCLNVVLGGIAFILARKFYEINFHTFFTKRKWSRLFDTPQIFGSRPECLIEERFWSGFSFD